MSDSDAQQRRRDRSRSFRREILESSMTDMSCRNGLQRTRSTCEKERLQSTSWIRYGIHLAVSLGTNERLAILDVLVHFPVFRAEAARVFRVSNFVQPST